jgi:hypothetical protein
MTFSEITLSTITLSKMIVSKMALSKMAFCKMTLIKMTFSKNDGVTTFRTTIKCENQHHIMLSNTLELIMLSAVMLFVIVVFYKVSFGGVT